jgi:glutaredoxin
MRIIRWLLGSLILFFDRLFSPKEIVRDADSQASVDKQTGKLALYQYQACPFCVKVRRAMKRHSLNIETRDAKLSDSSRDELLQGGGKLKVPCLRIEDGTGSTRWMYESSDIISYLEGRFVAQ